MFSRKIIQCKLLLINLVHRWARVRNCSHFVSVEFFPINGLSFTMIKIIGHHFGFHGLRFLKPSYVSIVALLPRPEDIGDSLYSFSYSSYFQKYPWDVFIFPDKQYVILLYLFLFPKNFVASLVLPNLFKISFVSLFIIKIYFLHFGLRIPMYDLLLIKFVIL